MSEGVIKFRCDWTREPVAIAPQLLADLGRCRTRLREAGLVGVLPDGIGFGNVSAAAGSPGPEDSGGSGPERVESPEKPLPHQRSRQRFLITGTGTGGMADLDSSHYALVTEYDIEKNYLACRGLTQASSESLSHAAIYAARPDVGAVLHVHSAGLWAASRGILPTTDPAFEYGTPELAVAVGSLVRGMEPRALEQRRIQRPAQPEAPGKTGVAPAPPAPPESQSSTGAVVLAGHQDGLMVFGPDLDGAGAEIMRLMEYFLPPSSSREGRVGG